MASDEYLWELMMQEAASGALGFEYLNDEPAFVSSSIQDDTPAVPSMGDTINECILNELFNFSDVSPIYKKEEFDTTVFTDIFLDIDSNVINVGLASDEIYTNSIPLPSVEIEPVAISPQPPFIILPELPSSPLDSEYHSHLPQFVSQSVPVVDSLSSQDVATISDLPPELLNRLLATITNMPVQDYDNDSITCEDYSMYSEESTLCSEDESVEHEESHDRRETRFVGGVLKVGGRSSDRKQRKMQQNRVAAHRYRQKKKAEQDAIRMDREKMEKRNGILRTRVQQMKQEIEYLRNLMNDMKKLRANK